jgi:DNA replication protein DnaC
VTEPDATELEADLRDLRERKAAAIAARGRRSGLPPKWRDLKWDDLDRRESPAREAAVDAAWTWAANPLTARGILLAGPVGIGKTRIAATAAAEWLRHGGALRWMPVTNVMMKLGLGFGNPDREKAIQWLESGEGALVLDDLDKVKPSDWQLAPLFTAINRWVDHEQPLLVTCNKTLAELERDFGERYGPPIASRLAEHCEVFEIKGRDRRVEP